MNVYDFDDTIYDGDSAVDFIFSYLIKVDPTVLRYVPAVFVAIIKYKRGTISLEDFTTKYADKLKKYTTAHSREIAEFVEKFWDKRMHKIKPFYKTLQRSDDVIITASPSFVISDICKRLGIQNVISTEFDLETGEMKKACFREGKIDCFREVYPNGEIDDFYTDSMNDKFLFPLAKRVFMVKGNQLTQIK